MAHKGHYHGPKHKGNHTTLIPAAEELVKKAEKIPEVRGIAPDLIKAGVRSKKPRIIFKPLPAGLQVKVIGNTSIQIIYIYTYYPKKVEEALST